MTKENQIKFVQSLTTSVCNEILSKIKLGKIPEEWDGMELRELLKDKFAYESGYLDGKRKNDYKNTVIEKNL